LGDPRWRSCEYIARDDFGKEDKGPPPSACRHRHRGLTGDGVVLPFVRDRKGRFTRIERPPGASKFDEYLDINSRGQIVGDYGTKPSLLAGVNE
jgi:hypothetical protein